MNRSVKKPNEILAIKKACVVADKTFDYILTKIKLGITERELVREIKRYIKKNSDGIAFKPIAAFGKNSYEFHHKPNNTKLKLGDFIMLDLGAKINGFCSDITRTVFFGKANAEQKRMYRTTLESQLKAIDFLKTSILKNKSVSTKETDKVARDNIITKGYPNIPHSLGHGIGKKVHSGLRLSPKSKRKLVAGMVFSVEPGIYIKDFGGVRIEDTVVLEKTGPKILTKSSKEIIEIRP